MTLYLEHVKAAQEWVRVAVDYPNGYQHLDSSDVIALAHVHATLALAVKGD